MGTLVALLVPEIPSIVSGLLGLFRSKHPTAPMPTDDEAVKALLAAFSGKKDFGPLSAIALEQLPQIREYILGLLKRHQSAPTEPIPMFTDNQLCDALEAAFKESRRKSTEVIDAWLAKHPDADHAALPKEAHPYMQELQIFANLLTTPPAGPQSVTIMVPAEATVTVEIHVQQGQLSIGYPTFAKASEP